MYTCADRFCCRSPQLTSLELQHATLGPELLGCLAGMTGLQVLTVGLCPKLSDRVVQEVRPRLLLLLLVLTCSLSVLLVLTSNMLLLHVVHTCNGYVGCT